MSKIKVYIVDDHELFIDGLKAILKKSDDIVVIGSSTSGKDTLVDLEKIDVDVLVTDISMPVMSGYDLCKIVNSKFPDIKILVLSMHHDYSYVEDMLNVGALGYVLKNTGSKELKEAIKVVASGNSYYSEAVKQSILNGYSKEKVKVNKTVRPNNNSPILLTPREKEILTLILKGYKSNEIGEILSLSYHTITSHRKNINAKIGTSNIAEITKIVNEQNLLD
jgi:DNA-binding NarL/FixJ family response regulator